MQRRKSLGVFYLILITFLFDTVYSAVLTNICTNTPSCNCTLTNNTDLDIICNSTLSLTQLPTLIPNTLQSSVTQLRIISSIANTKGPLIRLPTNICSYPNLTILDLSSNNISGFLNTSELSCLSSKLIHIDFSYNNINTIDIIFFEITRILQSINLSYNNLTTMPSINQQTFLYFPSTIQSMNFSFNQIISVDLWPLFVRTGNTMVIDMSYNYINNYTNIIPVSVEQLTETPDPRYFYLNNNNLTYFSDLLLEQYGACSTLNPLSTAYFIVGISNVLLTNNPLICDCQSYHLITYIKFNIDDFPEIDNGSALITQATCSLPIGEQYILTNFDALDNCENYTLPNITNIFCSLDGNNATVTLAPPTYSLSTTNGYETTESTNRRSNESSSSFPWYIILVIILGLLVILAVIIICYRCRYKFFPKTNRSKILNHVRTDGNNSYEAIIRTSENSSQNNSKLNGTKPHHASISTSPRGFTEQEKGTQELDDDGSHSDFKSPRDHQYSTDGHHPDQETQTYSQPIRSKPPNGRSVSTRTLQQRPNIDTNNTSHRKDKSSLPTATDVATNTTNGIKGIPISALPTKMSSTSSNGIDTSTSELSITSIPLAPSKRAKRLPQIKSGIHTDLTNDNLLNTSAGTLITSQRQRRRSSLLFRKQNQNMISPLPPRPQSMVAHKTTFDYDNSYDQDTLSIPTIESLTNKPSKLLRTVPLLNISVLPAWVDQTQEVK